MAKSLSGKTRDEDWYKQINGRTENKFVRYDLTTEQKATFKGWMADNYDKLADMMQIVVDQDYSLSVKLDSRGGGYAVFLTCRSEKSPNNGWVLTARGSHPLNALLSVLWKHTVLFDESWPQETWTQFSLDDE